MQNEFENLPYGELTWLILNAMCKWLCPYFEYEVDYMMMPIGVRMMNVNPSLLWICKQVYNNDKWCEHDECQSFMDVRMFELSNIML